MGPTSFTGKIVALFIILLAIRRTFGMLRIFESISTVVTMMNRVIF